MGCGADEDGGNAPKSSRFLWRRQATAHAWQPRLSVAGLSWCCHLLTLSRAGLGRPISGVIRHVLIIGSWPVANVQLTRANARLYSRRGEVLEASPLRP